LFQPVALETLGPIESAIRFLEDLGRRISRQFADRWLHGLTTVPTFALRS